MLNDLRHAARALVATPGATLVVIVILAAGIGLNTATLAFVDATVLNPLPFRTLTRRSLEISLLHH